MTTYFAIVHEDRGSAVGQATEKRKKRATS